MHPYTPLIYALSEINALPIKRRLIQLQEEAYKLVCGSVGLGVCVCSSVCVLWYVQRGTIAVLYIDMCIYNT